MLSEVYLRLINKLAYSAERQAYSQPAQKHFQAAKRRNT